jgi:alkanesulfonate monooxygenase SsuD/methylene tetrahydromethanopterin reductase-like flavin-dependent oxidoreductase (luciferase family)
LFVTALQDGLDTIRTLRSQIEQAAAGEKKQVTDAKIGFLRCCYASDNQAEIDYYLDCARFQRRLSEALHQRRQQSTDGYLVTETPTERDVPIEQLRKNLPVGSVNYVIDRLIEEISILKPDQVAVQTQLGDFDHNTMLRQIELWGEKIIPAVKRAVGSPKLMAAVS